MSKNNIADRMNDVAPFHVMKILAQARQLESQGKSIIHMEVGEPDFNTPDPITQAGIRALQEGHTHYTPATGLPVLKQAIADYYRRQFNVDIDVSRFIVTPGSSGGLQLMMSLLINPGEAVMLTDPGYPCNRHFVRLVEGEPLSIPVDYSSNYQITSAIAEEHWQDNIKAVLLSSPSNPTGSTISLEEINLLSDFLARKNAYLIMDEIYQGINFDSKIMTALQTGAENLFVVNSFSKYFDMTGWRLGWLVLPTEFVDAAERFAQNVFLAPQTMAQIAALEAFGDETQSELSRRSREFQRRRDYLIPELQNLGFKLHSKPGGAFYLYMDCSALTNDSYQFAVDLLNHAGVAITPGIDFGSYQAEKYVRFAYTTSLENLQEGVRRIASYLS
jgi:aspartate/methionine/tyrosine aminotransferase